MVLHPVEMVLPDEPPSVRLMNTVWLGGDGVFDCLRDGNDLRILLTALDRPAPARPSTAQVGAVRDLRDALRTLAATVTGGGPDVTAASDQQRAAATINAALAAAPVRKVLRATPEGWALHPSVEKSFAGSLGMLARNGAELIAGHGGSLRTCPAPSCGLYFVATHARRRWCSAHCGDRVRAARYYRRHHRAEQ